ncbi:MAG: hypothetical protein ACE5FN_08120 [Leptospirillia bacterium]
MSKQKVEDTFTSSEIKKIVCPGFWRKKGSVIPSDLCYNRVNEGINKTADWKVKFISTRLFIYLGKNQYRYVGPDYRYLDKVWHKKKGDSKDKAVGKWVERGGKRLVQWG